MTPLTGGWAFVDLETTGGNPARNRIIEVAVVAPAPFDPDHYRLRERWLRRHPRSARPLNKTP